MCLLLLLYLHRFFLLSYFNSTGTLGLKITAFGINLYNIKLVKLLAYKN